MVIMGVTTGIAVWLIGVPGAFVLGLIAGLLEVIPTFGPIIATIPAVLVALVQGSVRFPEMNNVLFGVLVIVVYVLLQQLESQLVSPRVLVGQSRSRRSLCCWRSPSGSPWPAFLVPSSPYPRWPRLGVVPVRMGQGHRCQRVGGSGRAPPDRDDVAMSSTVSRTGDWSPPPP